MIAAMGASPPLVEMTGERVRWIEVWTEGRSFPHKLVEHLTIYDVFEGMEARGVTVMHIHRSALGELGLPDELPKVLPGERAPHHPFMVGIPLRGGLVGGPLKHSTTFDDMEIMIGAYNAGGDPFEDAEGARELFAAHVAFRNAFISRHRPGGWAFQHSAAMTGWKLMHAGSNASGRRSKLNVQLRAENEHPELKGIRDGRQVEVPYGGRWARDVFLRPHLPLPYVMAWDVNGQRLAACSRLSVGVHGLEHLSPGDIELNAEFKLPGYHLVSKVEHPYEGLIPAIFEPGWHTTPRVAMAQHLGIPITIQESWVWTEHVPYFNPWYEAMRDARTRLMAGRAAFQHAHRHRARDCAIALDALKRCYLQPLGRLRGARERDSGSIFYRPSWYDAVIGQELAREYLRLHQLAKAGVPVLAVYFDTIIVEGEYEGLNGAGIPGIIEVSDQLGKYKPVGVLPREQALAALYTKHGPDVGALVQALMAGGTGESAPAVGTGRGVAIGELRDAPPALNACTRPAHGGYPEPVPDSVYDERGWRASPDTRR
jgi:hypothetical protein